MSVNRVILINAGNFNGYHARDAKSIHGKHIFEMGRFHETEQNLGLSAILFALRQNGFSQTHIFPNHTQIINLNSQKNRDGIIRGLKSLGADGNGTVIGISTTSQDYPAFHSLSRIVRESFPDATIVAGGPHFVKEEVGDFRDPVEFALQEGSIHAVVVGHAQPFVDFITKYQGKTEDMDIPGFYSWDPASRKVHGHGYGRFPQLNEVPYVREFDPSGKILTTSVIWDDTCANRCDFCSIPKSPSPLFPAETVIRSFPAMFEQMPHFLRLHDSNPFEPRKFGYYATILDKLDVDFARQERSVPPSKFTFLEPSLLLQDDYMDKLLILFQRSLFWQFSFGRDAVTEANAGAVGVNYRGKAKSQAQLDNEFEALKKFIMAMKEIARKPFPMEFLGSTSFLIKISYLLTPFETKESAAALLREMEFFQGLSDDGVRIETPLFPLLPYPGTRLRKNLLAHIFDPEDYKGLHRFANPWRQEIGPSYWFFQNAKDARLISDTEERMRRLRLQLLLFD